MKKWSVYKEWPVYRSKIVLILSIGDWKSGQFTEVGRFIGDRFERFYCILLFCQNVLQICTCKIAPEIRTAHAIWTKFCLIFVWEFDLRVQSFPRSWTCIFEYMDSNVFTMMYCAAPISMNDRFVIRYISKEVGWLIFGSSDDAPDGKYFTRK